MKKTDANLPAGVLGFRQPYGGIDRVDQWQELSGSNDAAIAIQPVAEEPVQKSGGAVEQKRT